MLSLWSFTENSGTPPITIHDAIGTNPGSLTGGFTLEGGVGIDCNPATTGVGCNITTANSFTNPQPFSFIFKFAGTVGGLIQFASPSSQTAAPVFYAAYIDNYGRLTFGVLNYGLDYVIQSVLPYSDGNIHIGIVSIGSTGMNMYVDGFKVATRNVQLANYTAGKWFFGGMNQSGWPYSPSSAYFNGTLYCLGWWNGTQLTDTQAEQITNPYPTPIPNNYCTLSGNIASVAQPPGYAYANQPVTITVQNQGPACGNTSPIAYSYQTYTTDASGNLPSGILIPQGAHFNLDISLGPPIPAVAPCSTSCPLSGFFPTATPTLTPQSTPTPTTTTTATVTTTPTATPTAVALGCIYGSQEIAFNIPSCGTTGSATLNVRAGDSLYVAVGNNGSGSAPSQLVWVSDNKSDTWHANDVLNAEGNVQSAAIGSSFSVTGGVTTVTAQIAGGTTCNTNVYLIESPPTNNLDVTANNKSVAAGTFDSGTTIATLGGSDFVLAVTGQNLNALTSGPNAGFSELADPSNNVTFAACNVVPVGTLADTQWIPNTFSGSYAAGIAAYKLVATATPTASPTATGPTPTATVTATPAPTPGFVQQAGTTSTGTSITPTFSGNATVGNTVILYVNATGAGTLDTLTVSGLNATWQELGGFINPNGTPQSFIYAGVVGSATEAVTVSGLANLRTTATIAEYADMPPSITQDGSPTYWSTAGSSGPFFPSIGGNITTTNAVDLVLCGSALTIPPFPNQTTWTNFTAQTVSSHVVGQGAALPVSNTGNYGTSWGQTPAHAYSSTVCAAIYGL